MPTWRGTVNSLWSNASNWLTDASGSGVPTATTNATFDASSPNCTVDTAAPVCASIDFTGYTATITMNNTTNLLVGSTTTTATCNVILSSGMTIAGTGGLATRQIATTNINTNGKTWPNVFWVGSTGAVTSTVNIQSNITVSSHFYIGSSNFRSIFFSGAFNISVGGNFGVFFTGSNTSGAYPLNNAPASAPKIILAGTGTWSTSGLFNNRGLTFGLNLEINTTGTKIGRAHV